MDTEPGSSRHEASRLKIIAIITILAASFVGVCTPILGNSYRAFRADSNIFFVIKSFAAGVILATGFVHLLPDAFDQLTNDSLPHPPWDFPFAGFLAMVAALITLMIDFCATTYYERRHAASHSIAFAGEVTATDLTKGSTGLIDNNNGSDSADEEGGNGVAMVTLHTQSHSIRPHKHVHSHHNSADSATEHSQLRHKVISQVLELGIITHSVIIGITMGVSETPRTIRPLIAALSFHQFFEGLALGGCIAQAGFKARAAAVMSFFFSTTTPAGIAIGMAISASYNENSPRALIVEGVFNSMSTGILIYMALVDLIATDFLSKRLQSNTKLQLCSYVSLFSGVGLMSLVAKWA